MLRDGLCGGCPGYAEPVYLKCILNQVIGKHPAWDVTLDEATGLVTWSFPETGKAFTKRGAFMVDKVAFGSFVVDRRSLAFIRFQGVLETDTTLPPDQGKCTFADVKRVF